MFKTISLILTIKINLLKSILIDISRKIKDFQNLQFLEIYDIMLTGIKRNVTILLLKYYKKEI